MSIEEQRRKNRERQQRFRDKKNKPIPDAWDYEMPRAQSEQLSNYSKSVLAQITTELGKLGKNDDYILNGIACTNLALEKGWAQAVHNPEGILSGGYFPDAIASEAIQHLRNSRLLESPAFVELYKRFLQAVAAFCDDTDVRFIDPDFALEIKAEIATQ
jgi:hypothetical protein